MVEASTKGHAGRCINMCYHSAEERTVVIVRPVNSVPATQKPIEKHQTAPSAFRVTHERIPNQSKHRAHIHIIKILKTNHASAGG